MLKLFRSNKVKRILYLIVLVILILSSLSHIASMWQNALIYSKDASSSTGVFVDASNWLSSNLGTEYLALVPMPDVFSVVSPSINSQLLSYSSLWASAGVTLQANTTDFEVLQVRNYLIDFLKENPSVRYVVRDWVDPYASRIFEANANDELMTLLREAKVIPMTLRTGWSTKITIYQRVKYSLSKTLDFSVPVKKAFTSPQNVNVTHAPDGATFHINSSRVGIYLPFEEGINCSIQNYLKIKIKPKVENLTVSLVFYHDLNQDGRWSGYDLDYVKSIPYQSNLRLLNDDFYTIYGIVSSADDLLVQLGIILQSENKGTITFSDIQIYTETIP